MKLNKWICTFLLIGCAVTTARGTQSLITPVVVDNTGGGADPYVVFVPGNWVTNDLTIQSDTDWTAAAILLELTSGSIYQNTIGVDVNAPSAQIIDVFPSVEFDTYVGDPHGRAAIAGGALDIPGAGLQEFSTSRLSISWHSPGADSNDVGQIVIGRITLSADANGFMTLGVWEAGSIAKTQITVPIANGVIGFPEPASLAVLGLGGLAVLRRR